MTRRVAIACAVFAAGMVVGIAVLRPAHQGASKIERSASAAVAAASGGHVVRTTCAPDHCGVVVREGGAATCEGWVVPLTGATLGTPRRAALVQC